MNKKRVLIIYILVSLITIGFVYAAIFSDVSQSDFNNGLYNNTFYNSSGFIQMNNSIPGNTTTIAANVTEMIGNETGLISYWRFNESSWNGTTGSVKDVLGKNNGTAKNGANTTNGLFGSAGGFDGVDDRISIFNKEELNPINGSFTITGWARSHPRAGGATAQWQLYVGKRTTTATDGYYVGLNQGNGLNFMIGDSAANRYDTAINGGSGYVPIAYNTWFYFAAVINRTSNQTLLYVNGTLSASRTFTTLGNINNSANLSFGLDYGQIANQGGYPVNGSIDEVAIWNRALSASEILALYNQGLNSTTITVNGTNITFGTYESSVKDTGSIAQWENISWNGLSSLLGELPNNQQSDSGISMSRNVLLYHLNEQSGTIADYSGLGNNGTQSGGVTYNSLGKFNSALGFDGANDYINIPNSDSLNLGNTLTISAWVYPLNLSSRPVIFSTRKVNANNGQFQLEIGTGNSHLGVVVVAGYNTWVVETDNNAVIANAWNHIVYTRNGTGNTHKIYVNGQLQNLQTTTAYDFADNTNDKMIGAGTNLLAMHFFNGTIDEVAVFNRTLSAEEVSSLYNRNGSGSNSNLKFQVRTSNDNATWTGYTGSDGTSGSYYSVPGSLNLSNSRYLQYKTYFSSSDDKLYNVSLEYDSSFNSSILVSLDSPSDNYLTNEYNGINITCSASSTSELANVTSYYSKFGWGEIEPVRIISGTSNTTIFTLNEITSVILWNCYFCDINGTCAFASANRTIIGDIASPNINLISPDNDSNTNLSSVNFVFSANDNRATSLDCGLIIDDVEVARNLSVLVGVNTTTSYSLPNGNYSWKINCSDGINSALSEEREINVSYFVSYTPFWAKANTHTHTTNSDGDSSPTTVVGLYKNKGYSILAITDHGYVTDCTPFTNLSANFLCVNSEEWTSTKHVVRVNVSAPYNNNMINMQNSVNAANAEGGFAIAAHPNWSSTIWSISDLTSLQNYTAMEIYNKVIERLTPDPYAVNKWDSVLLTGKKIFGVAADDMHQVNVDLGYGWTKVYMPEFTKAAYVNSMRTGYFYSSQGPNMDSYAFELNCDGLQVYHMGETANCSTISVNSTISATNSSFVMRNITLIKDGIVLNVTICSSENCSFSYSQNVSSSGYYRLQATDSNNKQIWSNPIWVNKIALPVIITVNYPVNNSVVSDYTPLINVSLNQQTSLKYSLNNGPNITLCSDCNSYAGYAYLIEGLSNLTFYANNSDNLAGEGRVQVILNFNKQLSENFSDNSSIDSTNNVFWNNGKISMNSSNMFGNFVLKPIITTNNITSFYVEWLDNNTENARGDGQRIPIIIKYRFGDSPWIYTDSNDNYIVNGSRIAGLNDNNLSLMLDFEKNSVVPIDLLNFRISWTEFTIPLVNILSPIEAKTYGNNTNIPLNFIISGGDIDSCWYNINDGANISIPGCLNTTFNTTEGSQRITVYSNGSLGNVGSQYINFRVNSSLPKVNPSNANRWVNYTDNVYFNYSLDPVAGIGISSCELWGNWTGQWHRNMTNYSVSSGNNFFILNLSEGYYLWQIRCNDTEGKFGYSQNATRGIDKSIPDVSISSPANNTIFRQNVSIGINFSVSEINLESCWYSFDNGPIGNILSCVNGENTLITSYRNGVYNLTVYVNDSAGNMGRFIVYNITIEYDSLAPNLTLSSPSGAKTSRTGITANWNVYDLNLQSCWYNVYRGASPEIANTLVNCNLNTTSFDVSSDGSYFFNFYANDSSGNVNSSSLSFSVDTSTPPINPPSKKGGGGGGGGGSVIVNASSNLTQVGKLSVSQIGSIIAREGDKKTLSLNVKNVGKIFLNYCRLVAKGNISSWIYSATTKGIAPGENVNFNFDLNVPEEKGIGDYDGQLEIKCDEVNNTQDIKVSIPGLSTIKIKEIKQDKKILKINYEFNNSGAVEENTVVEIWIVDKDKIEVRRVKDSFLTTRAGAIDRNLKIDVSDLAGIYDIYFALSDDLNNFIKQSVVIGKSGTTGFVIFDTQGGKLAIYVLFVLILAIAIFFIWKRNKKSDRSEDTKKKSGHIKDVKNKSKHHEDKWLLRKKAMSMVILFAIVLIAIVSMGGNLTGFAISNSSQANNDLLGAALFVFIICAIFLVLQKRKKHSLFIIGKYPSLNVLINKAVYTKDGEFLGRIKDILLTNAKIDKIRINFSFRTRRKFSRRGMFMKYNLIDNIGEVIILRNFKIPEIE